MRQVEVRHPMSHDSKASSQGIRARCLAAQGFTGSALGCVSISLVLGKTEGSGYEWQP